MAFFEELGKKISQVGYATVQKTKELADVSKINLSISEEERKLNDLYMQIGKKYVELHMDTPEDEFVELLEQIYTGKEKILSLKSEIEKIKGVICCENCGAEISEKSGFCSNCGAKIELKAEVLEELIVEEVIEKKLCTNCQTELKPDALFCSECGTKVQEEDDIKIEEDMR